jgi:hypothetical protein
VRRDNYASTASSSSNTASSIFRDVEADLGAGTGTDGTVVMAGWRSTNCRPRRRNVASHTAWKHAFEHAEGA